MRAKTMHNEVQVVESARQADARSGISNIVHCFSSHLFYALIPFIEHFLKQRRSIY